MRCTPASISSAASRLLFLGSLLLAVAACADAPPAPMGLEGSGAGSVRLGAEFSFGPMAEAGQADALGVAFDQVDRFRVILTRVPSGVLALDTVILVVAGQGQYDLTLNVSLRQPGETFDVQLTALEGTDLLFEAEPFQVQAGTTGQGGPASVPVTLVYRGPGVEAASIVLLPGGIVLAPGGSGQLTAEVRAADGSVVQGVPLAWSSGAPSVGSVSATGSVTGVGGGVASISVSTPTGILASVWVYVVSGDIAWVKDGHVHAGSVMGGDGQDLTPGASNASSPAWSPDGASLFYQDGGSVYEAGSTTPLVAGSAPAVSPDGTKLAVDLGGTISFSNDDGSYPTAGPSGTTPQWSLDGENLIVGGGSIQKVRADGSQRTTLVSATGATQPALSHPSGNLAYLLDSDADGRRGLVSAGPSGDLRSELIPETMALLSRPSWSSGEEWLLVGGGGGIYLVPADGAAPAIQIPGLSGATEAVWKPSGGLVSPPDLFLTSITPENPGPGETVEIQGGGFDWIIPENNAVLFPGPAGAVAGELLAIEEDRLTVQVPDVVVAGSLRVLTRTREASLAFAPAPGKLTISVQKPPEKAMEGIEVSLSKGGSVVGTATTDALGQIVLEALDEGAYEILVTPPLGFTVEGENPRTVDLSAGASASARFLLIPEIWSMRFDPEVPQVPVGIPSTFYLGLFDSQGDPISLVGHEITVSSASSHLTATGTGGEARFLGLYPCATERCAAVRVIVDGTLQDFPVTVTSRISGYVANAASEPQGDIRINLFKGGTEIPSAWTGVDGAYLFEGLLAGDYVVTPVPPDGFFLNPESELVTLEQSSPTGVADFLLVEQGAVYTGDLIIDSPSALLTFFGSGWGEVTGNLTISGTSLINLNGMESLQKVGGNLIFDNSLTSLANLNGLSGLLEVGGNVMADDVFNGLALNLPALTTVGGYFYFTNSVLGSINLPALTQVLDHFELITNTIGGPVVVGSSAGFTSTNGIYVNGNGGDFSVSIPGLTDPGPVIDFMSNPGLTSVTATQGGSAATTDVDIDIWNNPALTAISFPNMAQIMEMEIYDNPLLQSVDFPALVNLTSSSCHIVGNGTAGTPLTLAFPLLQSVGTNLEIGGAGGDIGALSFPSLTTIPNDLLVVNTTGLTSFSFPSLSSVGYAEISANQDLTAFWVPSLATVSGLMEVKNNPVLTDFDAGSLVSTGPDLIIDGNGSLTSFDLASFQGPSINIWNNGGLVSLPALPSLAATAGVYMDSNSALVNLNGLAGVTQIATLVMFVHPSLNDVSGLSSLQRIVRLEIEDIDAMTGMSFPSLTQVTLLLNIGGVGGAANLTSVSFPVLSDLPTLQIRNTPSLTTADFPSLVSAWDEVSVWNTGLADLNGFSALTSAVATVNVSNNGSLLSVAGLAGIGDAAASDPIVTGLFSISSNEILCTDSVTDLIAIIEDKFVATGAFLSAPVNTGNTGSCPGPSPGSGVGLSSAGPLNLWSLGRTER